MQRGRNITDDPTILIQRNDNTSLEARGRSITDCGDQNVHRRFS